MARSSTVFVCGTCGAASPKWQGQCAQCGEWNTLEATARRSAPGRAARPGISSQEARPLDAAVEPPRLTTGHAELDRVLGGGIVPGSVTLLGGDPGIGKSTLLLQVAAAVARAYAVVYASGEESAAQVSMRARRLGVAGSALRVLAETDLQAIVEASAQSKAALLVVDSIQTVQSAAVASGPGGVAQLRECAAELVRFAKVSGTAVMIIGHVTKEGAIAGPRVLEHLVDVVLYFESDAGSRFRIVRATKNRYGAVNELAFFAMTEGGLREVSNPGAIFLARPERVSPGSVVMVMRDGNRPLLIEIQALADPMRSGNPRRVALGLDVGRVSMLLAVLHRHGGLSAQEYDVFVNVVGGIEIRETAADLPLLLALVSSLRDRAIERDLVAFGELGLTGEIRPVAYGEERLREAAKQGFRRAVVPRDNVPRRPIDGLEIRGVSRLAEALDALG
jgi:DNA repair protein RadA/Sms